MKVRSTASWALPRMILLCLSVTLVLLVRLVRRPTNFKAGQKEGWWSPKTATMNWCEDDYVITPYVAEFFNAFSSLLIVLNGLYGYCVHSGKFFFETRFVACFAAFFVVGFGSFAFHATLIRSMQLLDELPMVYGNSVFIYTLWTVEEKPGSGANWKVALFLFFGAILETLAVIYFDVGEGQNAFLACYGSGVIYLIYKILQLNRKYLPNSDSSGNLHLFAIFFYLFGFMCWCASRNYCEKLKFLHLHSIWHVCAGIGTFCAVCHFIWLRNSALHRRQRVNGSLPFTKSISLV